VHTLTLHFTGTFGGGDQSEILFIGLKGEFSEVRGARFVVASCSASVRASVPVEMFCICCAAAVCWLTDLSAPLSPRPFTHINNTRKTTQQTNAAGQRNRRAVEAVYELRPVPEDHQVPGMKQGGHFDVA
jgi:hypothetical protein